MRVEDIPRYGEFVGLLQERLSKKKTQHCLSVAQFLGSFAPQLGIAEEQALTTGVLHDLCRGLKGDEMLRRARAYGVPITEVEEAKPNLLHGPVAAEECRQVLGVSDPEIYEAIYWHTTAKPGLCRLGQALYLADFSEPWRNYPEAERTRALLEEKGFDAALLYVAKMKMVFLERKKVVAPISAEFHRWLRGEFAL